MKEPCVGWRKALSVRAGVSVFLEDGVMGRRAYGKQVCSWRVELWEEELFGNK